MNALFGENAKAHVRGLPRQDLVRMHLKLEQLQCIPLSTEEFFTNIYADIDYCNPWGTSLHCPNPKCHAFSERVLANLHDDKLRNLQKTPNFLPIYSKVLARVSTNLIESTGRAQRENDVHRILKQLAVGPKLVADVKITPQ